MPSSSRRLALAAGTLAAAVGVLAAGIYLAVRPGAPVPARGQPHASAASASAPALSVLPPLPRGQPGTYHLATESLVFTERQHGSAGRRALLITVRFPAGRSLAPYRSQIRGLFPLVVFAPGFRQCARSYRDLLAGWATAGYVVAAVDFPLTSCTTAVPDEADVARQPADVAFVIRRLLTLSRSPHDRLAGLIDPARIAVSGHSDGGDTVAAMAAAACCRDRQVRAVVVLAGAEWPALPGRWFARPAPPMMFVQGTADTWNFPAASEQLYRADRGGARYYLDLPGADHFGPYEGDGAPEPLVARVTVDFLDYYLLGESGRMPAMRRAGRVPGVARLVSAGQAPP